MRDCSLISVCVAVAVAVSLSLCRQRQQQQLNEWQSEWMNEWATSYPNCEQTKSKPTTHSDNNKYNVMCRRGAYSTGRHPVSMEAEQATSSYLTVQFPSVQGVQMKYILKMLAESSTAKNWRLNRTKCWNWTHVASGKRQVASTHCGQQQRVNHSVLAICLMYEHTVWRGEYRERERAR